MSWTKTPPTEPGWYWAIRGGGRFLESVRCTVATNGIFGYQGGQGELVGLKQYEWWHPATPPDPPGAKEDGYRCEEQPDHTSVCRYCGGYLPDYRPCSARMAKALGLEW